MLRTRFDGLSANDLASLSWEEVEAWICRDEPIIFAVNSAEVLAQFSRDYHQLTVQLSVIENGGDGVVVPLFKAIESVSRQHGIKRIIWQVHALNCAEPNPKLQRLLPKLGFGIVQPDNGAGYWEKTTSINDTVLRRSVSP